MKINTPKFNQPKSLKALEGCILDLLEEIDTPRSLALAISYRYSNYRVVDHDLLTCEPLDYICPIDYKMDSQAVAFFKKSTYLESLNNLDKEAITNFLRLEEELLQFNLCKKTSFYKATVYTAARIMRSLLGPVPELHDLKVSYTSGATFSLRASDATIAVKLSNRLDVTPLAKPYLLKWLGSEPLLFRAYQDLGITEVPGNKFSTVPKDFRKVRTICKEPLGNMLLQRGFGLHIKDRLKRIGIYIETGQSDHIAILRYFSDCFSTIDQSDASDRISRTLVKDLLPLEWFHILDRIRSRKTTMPDGSVIELEKFMTQGNGFTFELETAIFYCLVQAMIINYYGKKGIVSVYGDDTIVSVHHGKFIVEHLDEFGLKVNTEKSYVDGPFKESCGFDIFGKQVVRPIYLKEFEPNETLFYVQFCNYIKRVLDHLNSDGWYNIWYSRPWRRCLGFIHPDNRLFGPPSLGDNVIIVPEKPVGYKHAYWKHGILYVTAYKRRYAPRSFTTPRAVGASELAYALLGGSSSGTLKRGAGYRLESARACPVNWT